MKYYAQHNGNNELVFLIASNASKDGTEISEAEYNSLLAEIRKKVVLVNQLYRREITIGAVPVEWQEEIRRRVDEWTAAEGENAEQDIGSEEFMTMLEEVL